jgi:hypothetical protein
MGAFAGDGERRVVSHVAGDREPNEAAWVAALKAREAWAWERLQAVALERVFRLLVVVALLVAWWLSGVSQ